MFFPQVLLFLNISSLVDQTSSCLESYMVLLTNMIFFLLRFIYFRKQFCRDYFFYFTRDPSVICLTPLWISHDPIWTRRSWFLLTQFICNWLIMAKNKTIFTQQVRLSKCMNLVIPLNWVQCTWFAKILTGPMVKVKKSWRPHSSNCINCWPWLDLGHKSVQEFPLNWQKG